MVRAGDSQDKSLFLQQLLQLRDSLGRLISPGTTSTAAMTPGTATIRGGVTGH